MSKNEIQSQIDDLLGGIDSEEHQEEHKGESEEQEDLDANISEELNDDEESEEKSEEEESEEDESEEESEDEDKDKEEESEEGNEDEEESITVKSLQAEKEALLSEIEKLSGHRPEDLSTGGTGDKDEEQETPDSLGDLVSDEEYQNALESKEGLNTLLVKFADRLRTIITNEAIEGSLERVPSVATQIASNQIRLRESIRQFYEDNPELTGYKQYVGVVASELRAKNPEWDDAKLMEKTGEEAYSRLKLRKKAKIIDTKSREPALAGRRKSGRGGRRNSQSDRRTPLQKEVDSLID